MKKIKCLSSVIFFQFFYCAVKESSQRLKKKEAYEQTKRRKQKKTKIRIKKITQNKNKNKENNTKKREE